MKPRLLFVIPDLAAGGAHYMNLRLARGLRARGWRTQVVVLFERGRIDLLEKFKEVPVIALGAQNLLQKVMLPFRLARLARRVDITIGGMEFAATNYGFVAAKLARRPFLSWTHTDFHRHQVKAGILDRLVSYLIYHLCRDIVFPSNGSKISLQRALGGRPRRNRWHVIENFIEPQMPETPVSSDGKIFSRPVVVGLGRLVHEKAFHRLIRAHAALRLRGLDHHLLILGDGPLRTELESLAGELGVSKTVFMPGHVDNPFPWLGQSQIFALCSHYEGFPLALLEALALGVPCVAMDCPSGPREILRWTPLSRQRLEKFKVLSRFSALPLPVPFLPMVSVRVSGFSI
ncbi:glycosyltransferase [Desulfosoma sp.]